MAKTKAKDVAATAEGSEPQPGDSDVSMNEGSVAAGEEPTLAEQEVEEATSLALAIREEQKQPLQAITALPSGSEFEASMAMARTIAGTQFVPESYRGNPEAVVAAIFTGRELGIGPMQ